MAPELTGRNRLEGFGSAEVWFRTLLSGRFQDVVFTSGAGIAQLTGLAKRLGVLSELISALGRARKMTVGIASTRALVNLKLEPDLMAHRVDSREIDRLGPLSKRSVGVLVARGSRDHKLVMLLEARGAEVNAVALPRVATGSPC